MSGQEDFIVSMVARLKRLNDDQGELDAYAWYSELLEGLKSGLKEVNCDGKRQGQVWFSKELKALRKEMHRKAREGMVAGESEWEQNHLRNEYLKARVAYSKAVKRAKRVYQRNRCEQLEREFDCPKRFWRTLKKMNVGKMEKQSRDLLRVYDDKGFEMSGEEAIEVWRNHFAKVLGGNDEGNRETSCTQVNTEETQPESSEHLGEPVSREEVQWALNEVKKDAAPGLDGVVMNMMQTEKLFEMNTGLRQGCVLSSLLFSLYINGAVKKLKEERCGVECGGETIPGLLFADDTCLMASDAAGLIKSLDVLVGWCKEWGVKINVAKSGVMHIRNKKAERCEMAYEVDGEAIPMVSSYKYLGCVVDEHLVMTEMVEERAEDGRRALGACFQRCQAEIDDIRRNWNF